MSDMEFTEESKAKGRAVFDRLSPEARKFVLAQDVLSVWNYEEDGEEKFAYRMRGCHVESGLSLEEMDADFSEYGAG